MFGSTSCIRMLQWMYTDCCGLLADPAIPLQCPVSTAIFYKCKGFHKDYIRVYRRLYQDGSLQQVRCSRYIQTAMACLLIQQYHSSVLFQQQFSTNVKVFIKTI